MYLYMYMYMNRFEGPLLETIDTTRNSFFNLGTQLDLILDDRDAVDALQLSVAEISETVHDPLVALYDASDTLDASLSFPLSVSGQGDSYYTHSEVTSLNCTACYDILRDVNVANNSLQDVRTFLSIYI